MSVENGKLLIGLTDHIEGPAEQPTAEILAEITDYVQAADRLGIDYCWFSEHHAHVHEGHIPSPLLYALHLASKTTRIQLGTAIICLNLHHPLAVAEQVATADLLAGGRLCVGFGSGSSPQEFGLFGLEVTGESERHDRFREALELILAAWRGGAECEGRHFRMRSHGFLPRPDPGLAGRCWQAANSVGSARIAGRLGFNMLYSHLRTPDQYREYRAAYEEDGGRGLIAANRPVYVARDDEAAMAEIDWPLRILWRRFQHEGKIPANMPEPSTTAELAAHPINFLIGGPATVARQIRELRAHTDFDVLNAELRWSGLSHHLIRESLRLLATEVRDLLDHA
jgi:alkanesulfonate monooxygenase SsuD/methylene tetrahydromethanopterin reductase-like flavin-dependent oxidoreductase (luciferase family)